jgi:hypothetical protein
VIVTDDAEDIHHQMGPLQQINNSARLVTKAGLFLSVATFQPFLRRGRALLGSVACTSTAFTSCFSIIEAHVPLLYYAVPVGFEMHVERLTPITGIEDNLNPSTPKSVGVCNYYSRCSLEK